MPRLSNGTERPYAPLLEPYTFLVLIYKTGGTYRIPFIILSKYKYEINLKHNTLIDYDSYRMIL